MPAFLHEKPFIAGKQTVKPVPVPRKVWCLVAMDLVGPMKKSEEGYEYILTLIDYWTKWVVLKPLKSKHATEVARALLEVYADWGVPEIHISDQGTEFCNKLLDGMFHSVCVCLFSRHIQFRCRDLFYSHLSFSSGENSRKTQSKPTDDPEQLLVYGEQPKLPPTKDSKKRTLDFANSVNKSLYEMTKTYHRITTAYHPQANGMVSYTVLPKYTF